MIEILKSQKNEKEQQLKNGTIKRDLISSIKLNPTLIQVLTGPRRAGKSTLGFQLLHQIPFGYVNFDDERLLQNPNGDRLLKAIHAVYGEIRYLFLDEIQNWPDWELFLNRLLRQGYSLVITGSNSQLLSGELATHLTGRYIEHTLYPFSFNEYLRAKNYNPIDNDSPEHGGLLEKHLDDYMVLGGYPEVVVNKVSSDIYLKALYDGILFKDIVKRYHVRYPQLLSQMGHYLSSNIANEFSRNRLCKLLDIGSVHTVDNYLEYLCRSYLVFMVGRYSSSVKVQIKSPRKVYAVDTGLVKVISFSNSENKGYWLENIVALELKRRGVDFFSHKNKDGSEVDFVIKKGNKIVQLIQVSCMMENEKTRARERKALIKASQELNCDQMIIITRTDQKMGQEGNIKIWNVAHWLLGSA